MAKFFPLCIKQSFCPLRESLIKKKKKIVTNLGSSKVTCTSAVPHVGASLSVNHLRVPELPGPRGTAGFLESPKPPQLLKPLPRPRASPGAGES